MDREEFHSMRDDGLNYQLADFDSLRYMASIGDLDAQAELRRRRENGETDKADFHLMRELAYARRCVCRYGGPAWNQYYGQIMQRVVSPVVTLP